MENELNYHIFPTPNGDGSGIVVYGGNPLMVVSDTAWRQIYHPSYHEQHLVRFFYISVTKYRKQIRF